MKIKRTAKLRGRVYEEKPNIFSDFLSWLFNKKSGGGGVEAKTEPVGFISARVYRVESNTWEEHGTISSGHVNFFSKTQKRG